MRAASLSVKFFTLETIRLLGFLGITASLYGVHYTQRIKGRYGFMTALEFFQFHRKSIRNSVKNGWSC